MKLTPRSIVVLALLAGPRLAAQDVPLPAALVAAKTAIVVNGGLNADMFDQFARDLSAWKRWTLVDPSLPADVTVTFTKTQAFGSNFATGQTVAVAVYQMTITQGATVLYSDTLQGSRTKTMLRKTLEKLDKRMLQQSASPKQ